MNQQVGDVEEPSQKSNYGRSVDEAKSLIKQLEAFKNSPAVVPTTTEDEPEKNTKNDVKILNTCKKTHTHSLALNNLFRWLLMSFFIPLRLPKCIKRINYQILMNVLLK